ALSPAGASIRPSASARSARAYGAVAAATTPAPTIPSAGDALPSTTAGRAAPPHALRHSAAPIPSPIHLAFMATPVMRAARLGRVHDADASGVRPRSTYSLSDTGHHSPCVQAPTRTTMRRPVPTLEAFVARTATPRAQARSGKVRR